MAQKLEIYKFKRYNRFLVIHLQRELAVTAQSLVYRNYIVHFYYSYYFIIFYLSHSSELSHYCLHRLHLVKLKRIYYAIINLGNLSNIFKFHSDQRGWGQFYFQKKYLVTVWEEMNKCL